MSRKLLAEISHNCRVKTYPDGTRRVLVASAPVFRESGYELADKWGPEPGGVASLATAPGDTPGEGAACHAARSKRRARTRVYDLAYSSDFSYFVTLTLDASRVDRYDMDAITRKLNAWLSNRVSRDGLRYVLVPERHQDGAVHFHGFINDALPVVDSGTLSDGGKPRRPRSAAQRAAWLEAGRHVVYNLPSWSFGFSTAIKLYGDKASAVGYVCKYVTKAQEKIGGRWYYSGGDLRAPTVELFDVDFRDFQGAAEAARFRADDIGVDFLALTLGGE